MNSRSIHIFQVLINTKLNRDFFLSSQWTFPRKVKDMLRISIFFKLTPLPWILSRSYHMTSWHLCNFKNFFWLIFLGSWLLFFQFWHTPWFLIVFFYSNPWCNVVLSPPQKIASFFSKKKFSLKKSLLW